MLNKVMIIGRLGHDPELKYSQTGTPICTMNIATNEFFIDRDGNRMDRTEWHRVTVFQRLAERCNNVLSKGSLVYVEGSLSTRKWQDQQGQSRYITEIRVRNILFLDSRSDGQQNMYGSQGGSFGQGGNRPFNRQQTQYAGEYDNMGRISPSEEGEMNNPHGGWRTDRAKTSPSEAGEMESLPFEVKKQAARDTDDEFSGMDDVPF